MITTGSRICRFGASLIGKILTYTVSESSDVSDPSYALTVNNSMLLPYLLLSGAHSIKPPGLIVMSCMSTGTETKSPTPSSLYSKPKLSFPNKDNLNRMVSPSTSSTFGNKFWAR